MGRVISFGQTERHDEAHSYFSPKTRHAKCVFCNTEALSCSHCSSGKAVSITYCECICSIIYAACNAHAPYCHLWPIRLYNIFPHYLTNGMIFERKKKLLIIKCVFWFSLPCLSETILILKRTERDMIKLYVGLHVTYPLFLSDFNETWIFSTHF